MEGGRKEITGADDVGKLGPWCIAEGNMKWCHATKTSMAVSYKIKQNYPMIQQCHSGYPPKGIESKHWQKILVHPCS